MDEQDILEDLKRWSKDLHHLYSPEGQQERERWVAASFLSGLGLTYEAAELMPQEQASKIDIAFRDAGFQIKEITDPDSQISGYAKAIYRSVHAARGLSDICLVGKPQDAPAPTTMIELVTEKATTLAAKYETTKSQLDLLFYITRTRAGLLSEQNLNTTALSELGWRSISCVNARQAVVLCASPDAPAFLRELVGKVRKIAAR